MTPSPPSAQKWTRNAEDAMRARPRVPRRVIRRLQDIFHVRLARRRNAMSGADLPEDIEHHPNFYLAFSQQARTVYYTDLGDSLRYLPHEIVHVVWPGIPADPEDEWASGMIDYELAWLERICRTPMEQACLAAWRTYAEEGNIFEPGENIRQAKVIIDTYRLPDPWRP